MLTVIQKRKDNDQVENISLRGFLFVLRWPKAWSMLQHAAGVEIACVTGLRWQSMNTTIVTTRPHKETFNEYSTTFNDDGILFFT
jgi:hypothetical protein